MIKLIKWLIKFIKVLIKLIKGLITLIKWLIKLIKWFSEQAKEDLSDFKIPCSFQFIEYKSDEAFK